MVTDIRSRRPSPADEFLRRARHADTVRREAPRAMPAREQTQALADVLMAFVTRGLPHIDNALTAPVVQLTLTVPGTGEHVLTAQLPEEMADTLIQVIKAVTADLPEPGEDDHASVTALPARPVRRLSLIPGGGDAS